ncbi:DUF6932 family protein [Kitasatospora phosalacinea]|uniref:Uncharacterized protein n=1 Tax=Kitasatospora phosalacinea TaxID=2065 RepID=A0A9W6PQX3_9ACTN|nr:hypothetical protein [Kitasatospora phosalacinea]GLW59281.1 hypothetical protein Kpho01_72910 [Kitasatospora phosalacinea]
MIPELTVAGVLPPGRHLATFAEIDELFVKQAPHADRRRRIFRAFEIYMEQVADVLPSGSVWLDGGFCTYKSEPPKDMDLALLVDRAHTAGLSPEGWEKLDSLRTLQGVYSQMPKTLAERVQPMGGLIDSFIVVAGEPALEDYWHGLWSSVKGPDGEIMAGQVKGYLEVIW